MKEEPHHRLRTPDDAPGTVIHHYEDDETLLARWLRKGMDQGPTFWLVLGGVVAAAIIVGLLLNNVSTGESTTDAAWTELILARGADDLQKIAEAQPDSRVSAWALLRAAEVRYREGFGDLPNNREAALPLLKQAYDLFEKAEQAASKDTPVKRLSALGMARTLESRNELEPAIKQYEAVASTYSGTDEGKEAETRAKLLRDPANVQFYKDFYAFKPRDVTLPPGGRGLFNMPGGTSIPGFPSSGSFPGINLPPVFGPDSPPSGAPATGGGELPKNVFENPPPPLPTPESATKDPAGKAEAPKDSGTEKPAADPKSESTPKPKS
jgi:hypothetical protein